jgi:hypothetical protein
MITMKPQVPARIFAVVLAACLVPVLRAVPQAPAPDGWRLLEGSWNASGERQVLPTDGGRQASTTHLSGAIVLVATEGTSRGFQGESITFDDGAGVSTGRAVWTDERGDRVFSRLTGDALLAGRRILGTFTGGTGRYAGIEGDYQFEWQYVVQPGDGTVQGRAVNLKGRFRATGAGR